MQMINTDQAIFDAIVAAVRRDPVLGGTVIDVQKFIDTFNNHRDRKLCTSIDSYEVTHLKAMLANEHQKTVPVEERNRIAQEIAQDCDAEMARLSGIIIDLLKYANHLTTCRYRGGHDCDCGLDEVRAAAEDQFMDDYKRDTTNAMAARILELEALLSAAQTPEQDK